MLAAELNLERQTIETLSDAFASVRVDVSVLERESLRLAQTVDRRDELIAVLKRDLAAVQSDRAEGQDARRGTINLLNTQNDELISELRSLRNQLNGNADTLRSLQDQLVRSESEQARLAALVEQREAQITILTDTQSGILEQLEAQVEQQMAALRSAIDMTGVDHDTSLQLDALLESVQDPFWNGMGGANDGMSVPRKPTLKRFMVMMPPLRWCQISSTASMRLRAATRSWPCGVITSTPCRPVPRWKGCGCRPALECANTR